MRIRAVRERTLSLGAAIRNSYVDFSNMTVSVIAVESDIVRNGRAVTGYGFASPGRYAQGELTRSRVVPRILAADANEFVDPASGDLDPERVNAVMRQGEKPGGHGDRSVAIAAVDVAMWDLAAKLRGVPLTTLFAERYGDGTVREDVWVYGAGGYYTDGGTSQTLADELSGYLDLGFREVKLKIGSSLAFDHDRIVAAVDVADGAAHVAVDASGRLDPSSAHSYAEMLEPFGLLWFEDAGDPLDYELQAALCADYAGPMATGENLFSLEESRNLLRYGGMRPDRDILLMDPALCYGPTEYVRIVLDAEARGWGRERFVPHGGNQVCLALAAGLGLGGTECYPGVFQPIGGFADEVEIVDGRARTGSQPGLGVEGKADLWAVLQDL